MKKAKLILSVACLVFIMSCKSDDNNSPVQGNTNNVAEVSNIMQSGTWHITKFIDSGNETEHFAGYNFTFMGNGVLKAVKGDIEHTGTWFITNSDSSDDDNNGNDTDFNIGFNAPPDFEELTDDWDITEVSPTVIKLKDVSRGNDSTDHLTFEKH